MQLNAEKIKNSLTREDIIKIMEYLGSGLHYEREDEFLVFYTICHNVQGQNASPKLYYYFNTKLFTCFTQCKDSWDIFELFKIVKSNHKIEVDFYTILKEITELAELNLGDVTGFSAENYGYISELDKFEPRKFDFEFESYNPNVLAAFSRFQPPEWYNEGISYESMTKYEVGYCIPQERIIIPHRDARGKLVGIRGRAMNPYEVEMGYKYMPITVNGVEYTHQVSYNLYGIHLNKEAIKGNMAVLFEGEKSVMKLDTILGEYNNSLAVCGNRMSAFQFQLMLRECRPSEIVIAFDKEYDKPFTKESSKEIERIEKMVQPYQQYCSFSTVHDISGLLEKKDSPIDRGEEVYFQLLSERISL